ncbi:chemotaxis protein CheW [Massilia sp. TWR1-2-2]|uniref:chemotaxis protein CheW n=1 Tax=Massilia sp. TWR1-2-2 TaxID=2804584 RepID=UPI003CEC66DE
MVDGVSDFTMVNPDQIKPPPSLDCDISYVTGIASIEGRLMMLIDMNLLLFSSTLLTLDALGT